RGSEVVVVVVAESSSSSPRTFIGLAALVSFGAGAGLTATTGLVATAAAFVLASSLSFAPFSAFFAGATLTASLLGLLGLLGLAAFCCFFAIFTLPAFGWTRSLSWAEEPARDHPSLLPQLASRAAWCLRRDRRGAVSRRAAG